MESQYEHGAVRCADDVEKVQNATSRTRGNDKSMIGAFHWAHFSSHFAVAPQPAPPSGKQKRTEQADQWPSSWAMQVRTSEGEAADQGHLSLCHDHNRPDLFSLAKLGDRRDGIFQVFDDFNFETVMHLK
jgi:hypothetical protein